MTENYRVIEFVGPPGSGKTTLAEILIREDKTFQIENAPYFRNIKYSSFFARNLVYVLPTLFSSKFFKGKRNFSMRDLVYVILLIGWCGLIKRKINNRHRKIILEEGGICLLGKLYGSNANLPNNPAASKWWRKIYGKWANTLDLLVVFETSTPVLLDRIRHRPKQYEIEYMSDADACRHLDRIRHFQEIALQELLAQPNPPVIRYFNTIENKSAQIAGEILSLIISKEN
jgi:hypothetical protein